MESASLTWATVSGALGNVWDIVGDCVEHIAGNPVLLTCLCAGLIPIGFRIFRKARKSVR